MPDSLKYTYIKYGCVCSIAIISMECGIEVSSSNSSQGPCEIIGYSYWLSVIDKICNKEKK